MINKVKSLVKKYREIIVYLVFGVLTTAVNWLVYSVLVKYFCLSINLSNTIAWFAAVIFAFITNKIWVFGSRKSNFKVLLKEFWLFFAARILSGVFEIGGLNLAVRLGFDQTLFGVKAFLPKIIISFVVVILNYIFSKLIVFKKEKGK
ncbi:MAG TPA: GtrA family protein [Oscillospiraceae bacterium]|nr:GtrA family protein [Oscillospiraceae bacterium]